MEDRWRVAIGMLECDISTDKAGCQGVLFPRETEKALPT